MGRVSKLDKIAQRYGFSIEQKPKGHGTIVLGGKKLAAAVRKPTR